MNKMRKFANREDLKINVLPPLTDDEIQQRHEDYVKLKPEAFKKKYRQLWSRPAIFQLKGKEHKIQLNVCTNSFCRNYGLPQEKFNQLKGKPSRYKLIGGKSVTGEKIQKIECTSASDDSDKTSLRNTSGLMSNWSVAEEVVRLSVINSVVPDEFELVYHYEGCVNAVETPKSHPKTFYKRGKSKVGAQRYQCKACGKTTNEQPKQKQSFSYNQQKNDVVFDVFNDMMNRTPVIGSMRKNGIGAGTYYQKMEWIYRKCLEFLERHEDMVLETKEFKELYLNTDAMIYNLNYKRLKSEGRKGAKGENKLPPTYIYATADTLSGYVFRADVAYDFKISLEEIEQDTLLYHCDHTQRPLRKNERLRHEFKPQKPTAYDAQTQSEFEFELNEFEDKRNYVNGLHVKPSYTCAAHLWFLKEALKSNKYYFVCDNDPSLHSQIHRMFHAELKTKKSHLIVCEVDKTLTQQQAGAAHFKQRAELTKWAKDWGYSDLSTSAKVRLNLEELLAYHDFYEEKEIDGSFYKVRGVNPIEFPLPFMDEGYRRLTCLTDVDDLDIEELARILSKVNGRAIDDFFQKIHRSISVLERPLNTSRGDGKSYIYANYNPRYAQYLVTILRVYYNFCLTNKRYGEEKTPAQRLGITEKVFTIKDIIYFK